MNLARAGNKYLADTEPWHLIKTDPERVKTILYISLQLTASLSVLVEPFLPFSAKKLTDLLNIEKIAWKDADQITIKSGHLINEPELLFQKIEDKEIEFQINKLLKTKEENKKDNIELKPIKETISFDDFQKLDIRTATILEAEKVKKTKKLLKITLDTGIDKRIVVSGIAEFYTPEGIIGKQVQVLVNLAPRKLKGIESQGMILMAENSEGKLCFVSPEEGFENGAIVN